jgi:1,4-dihydroxy-2-naphthoyl-CoA hydrolase
VRILRTLWRLPLLIVHCTLGLAITMALISPPGRALRIGGEAGEGQAVGLEINANHLRAMTSGTVTGTARPVHVGRSTQVWDIRIEDEQGRAVCVSRLTLAMKK